MENQVSYDHKAKAIVCILREFEGQFVNIRVLGDWMFSGKLVELDDKQVCLVDVTVISAGGLTLCTFDVPKVRIYLEAITSAGRPALLPW